MTTIKLCLAFSVVLLLGLQGCATAPGGGNIYLSSDTGRHPAVIIFHSSRGLSTHEETYALRLSNLGYIALTVDYFRGSGTNITDGYEHLVNHPNVDPNRIGLVGFSRGARAALFLASRLSAMKNKYQISGVVSYYIGNAIIPWVKSFKHPPVLFLHGDQDQVVEPIEIINYCKTQRESNTICEFHIYEGVKHAFDKNSFYGRKNPSATTDARKRDLLFLEKYVKRDRT